MCLLKWFHRYAVWFNVSAFIAVMLWAGWAWSVVYARLEAGVPMRLQRVHACPCQQPDGDQRAAMRI
ncbi:hypothetical protein F4827_004786 [Paraburkholderia bannensis]|uniref:Uncharacterized protein n=1 Tax=Paraburkholderia bannensis TaxID=765414 RepID=A0A7W9WV08_9BURK|nr:hypothetical protein [Paraburkholderia sp. WP4_3_2]MBB6104921.1 hypothetical protein [Paraburkholderia bannensis]